MFAIAPAADAAITATFTAKSGTLNVFGDGQSNVIAVGRDATGRLLVNRGAVAVNGGTATVANTALIQVFGQAGNDQLTLDEANGALPPANLFGGVGDDTMSGGSGADQLFGQAGKDSLLGKGGNDFLFAGDDNDTLTGGDGADQVFGQAGNDRLVWNPGDDTDLNEGGDAVDTVEVNGGNGTEQFTATPNGSRVRFDRIQPAPFTLDIGTTENLVVHANGGDDTFTGSNGLAALIALTVDGGAGIDTLTGGDGADVLSGGVGADTIAGGRGNDVAFLGDDNDAFVWNPGDGSDTVEGQAGTDTLAFNGANVAESFDLSANGSRLRFTRNVASVAIDANGLENVDVHALGGADTITETDLSGTGVTSVDADLGAADGATDTVVVKGTSGDDRISAGADTVTAGSTAVRAAGGEAANDRFLIDTLDGNDAVVALGSAGDDTIGAAPAPTLGQVRLTGLGLPVDLGGTESVALDGRDGNDTLTGSTGLAVLGSLVLDGGAGNDVLLGGDGADVLVGGDGDDAAVGRRGDDVAALGAGDDVFQWAPGDGSDIVQGQDGADGLAFNGANVGEKIELASNGSWARLSRDVANITLDLAGVENIDLETIGGSDAVTVDDLTGTGVANLVVGLGTASNAPDGAADSVTVDGTAGDDVVSLGGSGSDVEVAGLPAHISVLGGFPADRDRLTVDALGGDDVIEASSVSAGALLLTLDGGDGSDVLLGGEGDDTLLGGPGDDVLIGNAGNDTIDGGPGNNIVIDPDGVNSVAAATAASTEWLKSHIHVVDGKTVVDAGGKQHVLPHADLARLLPTR
jgi:Ca2+-binding RTX toxin-like protein